MIYGHKIITLRWILPEGWMARNGVIKNSSAIDSKLALFVPLIRKWLGSRTLYRRAGAGITPAPTEDIYFHHFRVPPERQWLRWEEKRYGCLRFPPCNKAKIVRYIQGRSTPAGILSATSCLNHSEVVRGVPPWFWIYHAGLVIDNLRIQYLGDETILIKYW